MCPFYDLRLAVQNVLRHIHVKIFINIDKKNCVLYIIFK